jgi:hypothetical protein
LQKLDFKKFDTIYVNLGGDSWEYPTWYFFSKKEKKPKILSFLELDRKNDNQAILCINIKCEEYLSDIETFDVNVIDGMALSIRNVLQLDCLHQFNDRNPVPGGTGWSFPETWGTWSEGNSASLPFSLSGSEAPETVYLNLNLRPYLPTLTSSTKLTIELNSTVLGEYVLSENRDYSIEVPFSRNTYFDTKSLPVLSFNVDNAQSPSNFGSSKDTRKLEIGLKSIEFSAKSLILP